MIFNTYTALCGSGNPAATSERPNGLFHVAVLDVHDTAKVHVEQFYAALEGLRTANDPTTNNARLPPIS